ncbi:30S ribosomal protein S14 [Clostridium botulinum A1 str. CFSAN002368]|nr:30S ribosomal protein S14 [Clostridium botulinum A1 str. CFSAN002368]
MARKALIEKWNKTPKYSTRAYTRCRICGRPHAVLKNTVSVVYVLESLLTKVKYLDAKKPAGNIRKAKGGKINGNV